MENREADPRPGPASTDPYQDRATHAPTCPQFAGDDGRARGLVQFNGAGRAGRFAGHLVQVQNLPRNYLPDLAHARELVLSCGFDAVELVYDSVPDTLSQLVRTAFIPSEGHQFIVADFSATEARVIA